MTLILIILALTVVIAAIGAAVYVLVFRSKHKKEVMQNSQYNVPTYGPDPNAGGIASPMGNFGQAQTEPQTMASATSPVMNDIVQGPSSQPTMAQDMPPVPMPPAPEAASGQATVNRNFPDVTNDFVVPASEPAPVQAEETPVASTSFQDSPLMDNTNNPSPITDAPSQEVVEDSIPSTVPTTNENETLPQVENNLNNAEVSQPAAPTIPDTPVNIPISEPVPPTTPEPPAVPQMNQAANPSPTPDLNQATPDFATPAPAPSPDTPATSPQTEDTKEMPI